MPKSIEEKVEDLAKRELERGNCKFYLKTESINEEIEKALREYPSKKGRDGGNKPDIKLFIITKKMRKIPIMIEVKGTKGDLIKLNKNNEIDNIKKDGNINYINIQKYAVNGAVHYANAILDLTNSYNEVIATGINGYRELGEVKIELGVYYISKENFKTPKKIGEFSDLTFLYEKNVDKLIEQLDILSLTDEEKEVKEKEYENLIEESLKKLNQKMQDDLQISVGSRVELITGMIMAGLGVDGKVAPLEIEDLKGDESRKENDGTTILRKIDSFLEEKNLPEEKKEMIINDLSRVFIYSNLWKPIKAKSESNTVNKGESKLKTVYAIVKNNIMPLFTSARHLDFTGNLFNILNEWVDIPDGDRNDVVLTPRYVTELMAKLVEVNKDSYVWDYAVGSAGFLISAMKLMLKDAEDKIKSLEELEKKKLDIKSKQLLGIEKRADIYLLAVLNMILMGDGSSNILHKDSLKDYEGKYEQGKMKDIEYPANVFLLNPPYSAEGKGFIFVKKALSKMESGKAAILIQENAGSGNGLPYTKDILEKNTLLASIHMSNIFLGKADVPTAIYVFDVGKPHNEKALVKFIDFSNDGYTRANRKKSSKDVNLRNTDHAEERYSEVVDLVLYGKSYLKYLSEDEYIEDTISLEGNDWTFIQHRKNNTIPTEEDFRNTIKEYLSWKVSQAISEDDVLGKK